MESKLASDWDIMKIIGHGRGEDGVFVVYMSKNMSKEKLNVVDLSNSDRERAWMIWLVLSKLESTASCQ